MTASGLERAVLIAPKSDQRYANEGSVNTPTSAAPYPRRLGRAPQQLRLGKIKNKHIGGESVKISRQ
jgi:hypothetical protein